MLFFPAYSDGMRSRVQTTGSARARYHDEKIYTDRTTNPWQKTNGKLENKHTSVSSQKRYGTQNYYTRRTHKNMLKSM